MIEITLRCDKCKCHLETSDKSAREARELAEERGIYVRIGRRDLCVRCADDEERASELAHEEALERHRGGAIFQEGTTNAFRIGRRGAT